MKFGKSLLRCADMSDPEWAIFWVNYKLLKKKIKGIVESSKGVKNQTSRGRQNGCSSNPADISKNVAEVEFFRVVRAELKKTSDFFLTNEKIFQIRYQRVLDGFVMLQKDPKMHDKNTWCRLLAAIVKFYRDALMLENFAIMNYCAFSKILKKHDKATGFITREAFMRNVMSSQNITHYPLVLELLQGSEKLFTDIQQLESCMPLQDEERLFIETMRELNRQAAKMQAGETFKKEKEDQNEAPKMDSSSSHHPCESEGGTASGLGSGGTGGAGGRSTSMMPLQTTQSIGPINGQDHIRAMGSSSSGGGIHGHGINGGISINNGGAHGGVNGGAHEDLALEAATSACEAAQRRSRLASMNGLPSLDDDEEDEMDVSQGDNNNAPQVTSNGSNGGGSETTNSTSTTPGGGNTTGGGRRARSKNSRDKDKDKDKDSHDSSSSSDVGGGGGVSTSNKRMCVTTASN